MNIPQMSLHYFKFSSLKNCITYMRNWCSHGRRKVHDYFLLLLCILSIWFTEKHIFKIIIYIFFNTSICAANYVISFEVFDGFIGQNFLKLWREETWPFGWGASRPWMFCQYKENRLVELPSSVSRVNYFSSFIDSNQNEIIPLLHQNLEQGGKVFRSS